MTSDCHHIDVLIKLGGGLLADRDAFSDTLALIASTADRVRLVVVPGGGPFADAVRTVDQQHHLADDAAHWMAMLAMDQYAHLVAASLAGGVVVDTSEAIADALSAGQIPVLAPYRWLHDVDPLPHSWDVTSDSIAAWIAGQLDVRKLILVKPPGATEPFVDAYFTRALPHSVTSTAVPAGISLRSVLAAC